MMQNTRKVHFTSIILVILVTACTAILPAPEQQPIPSNISPDAQSISLPEPKIIGELSLEETIANRRSVRSFQDRSLTEQQIGQLLWAAQGITDPSGLRAAPSAGATFPLEIYVATSNGLTKYLPDNHSMIILLDHDIRPDLYQASLRQDAVRDAPLMIIITADYSRTSQRYGQERTPRYVHLEAGHAAQNILLQAITLGLGAVPVGAFDDDQVIKTLALFPQETPLYLIPVGYPP